MCYGAHIPFPQLVLKLRISDNNKLDVFRITPLDFTAYQNARGKYLQISTIYLIRTSVQIPSSSQSFFWYITLCRNSTKSHFFIEYRMTTCKGKTKTYLTQTKGTYGKPPVTVQWLSHCKYMMPSWSESRNYISEILAVQQPMGCLSF